MTGLAVGPVVLLRSTRSTITLLADDPDTELERPDDCGRRMQRGLDDLFAEVPNNGRPADVNASREVLEAYRLVACGCRLAAPRRRCHPDGMTAEAAVQRVAGRVARPYAAN